MSNYHDDCSVMGVYLFQDTTVSDVCQSVPRHDNCSVVGVNLFQETTVHDGCQFVARHDSSNLPALLPHG